MTKLKSVHILVIAGMVSVAIWIVQIATKPVHTTTYSSVTFYDSAGWGYDILADGKLIIRQDIVPAITTTKGFARQEQAQKAAALVIKKLTTHHPPALSAEEIQTIIAP